MLINDKNNIKMLERYLKSTLESADDLNIKSYPANEVIFSYETLNTEKREFPQYINDMLKDIPNYDVVVIALDILGICRDVPGIISYYIFETINQLGYDLYYETVLTSQCNDCEIEKYIQVVAFKKELQIEKFKFPKQEECCIGIGDRCESVYSEYYYEFFDWAK